MVNDRHRCKALKPPCMGTNSASMPQFHSERNQCQTIKILIFHIHAHAVVKFNITTLIQLVLILSMAYLYLHKVIQLSCKTSGRITLPLVSGNSSNQSLIAMNQSSEQQKSATKQRKRGLNDDDDTNKASNPKVLSITQTDHIVYPVQYGSNQVVICTYRSSIQSNIHDTLV